MSRDGVLLIDCLIVGDELIITMLGTSAVGHAVSEWRLASTPPTQFPPPPTTAQDRMRPQER